MKHVVRTRKDLGHLVREARKARGWTQAELAKRIKTTQKSVSLLEGGRTDARLDTVLRALAVLRVQLSGDIKSEQKSADSPADLYPSQADALAELNRRLAPLNEFKKQIDKSLEPFEKAQAAARRATERLEEKMRPLDKAMKSISKQQWYENYNKQLDRFSSLLPPKKGNDNDD